MYEASAISKLSVEITMNGMTYGYKIPGNLAISNNAVSCTRGHLSDHEITAAVRAPLLL